MAGFIPAMTKYAVRQLEALKRANRNFNQQEEK